MAADAILIAAMATVLVCGAYLVALIVGEAVGGFLAWRGRHRG